MRRRLTTRLLLAVAVAGSLFGGAATALTASPAAAGDALGAVTPVASGVQDPVAMTTGPDGALWLTMANDSIGRVTTGGAMSSFAGPGIAEPQGITTGPDGNLWFANLGDESIGRITPGGVISRFAVAGMDNPGGITAGPDGNLWFTSYDSSAIGRITPAGAITLFTGDAVRGPLDIVAGPDGNLWFANYAGSSIGRITPSGASTSFPIEYQPTSIAAGPDGNLWFSDFKSVGRITPAGVVTTFSGTVDERVDPEEVTAGPDGNVWFTMRLPRPAIGRITPAGAITTFYAGPDPPHAITAGPDGNVWFSSWGDLAGGTVRSITPAGAISMRHDAGISFAGGVTPGPDGNLWFTNAGDSTIGRVTPEGAITTFSDAGMYRPQRLATGPDGNLWFTQWEKSSIGRMTPTGEVTFFQGADVYLPYAITAGPDGNMWFTNPYGNWITRITPAGQMTRFGDPSLYHSYGIVAGADGNLWFTNFNNSSIGRITPDGVISNFSGDGISKPFDITATPDGNLWFTNTGDGSIGRITPAGVVTSFPGGAGPQQGYPQIAADGAGNVWYTWDGTQDDWIGRITPAGVTTTYRDIAIRSPIAITAGMDGNMSITTMTNRIVSLGTSLPGAPRDVRATAGDGQATVTWAPPASDGGSTLRGYSVVASPGGRRCAWYGGPLSCTVTGLSVTTRYRFSVITANASGASPASVPTPAMLPLTPGSPFSPLTPTRILDSRLPAQVGPYSTPWRTGQTRDVTVAGTGGVPAAAGSVVLNVTVTGTTGAGYLTIWPAGQPMPVASSMNWAAGQTVANAVTVKAGAGGKVSIFDSAGDAQVIVDAVGWYGGTAGDGYTALPPVRISDSRTGPAAAPWGPKQTRDVVVAGVGGVDGGAEAVVVNVTVTGTTAAGYLTVWPAGQPRPVASSLNWAPGQTVANAITVKAGAGGKVSVYNAAGSTHVIVDVVGSFAPGTGQLFHGVPPARIQDSRPPKVGAYGTPWGSGTVREVQVAGGGGIPLDVTAALMNVTATATTASSFLTIAPAAELPLVTSSLNWQPGQTVANAVTTKLGPTGKMVVRNGEGSVHVLADTAGWYA